MKQSFSGIFDFFEINHKVPLQAKQSQRVVIWTDRKKYELFAIDTMNTIEMVIEMNFGFVQQFN